MVPPTDSDEQAPASKPRHSLPAAPMGRRSLLTLGSLGAVVAIGGAGLGVQLLSTSPEAPSTAEPPPTPAPTSGSGTPSPSTSAPSSSTSMSAPTPIDRDQAYAETGRSFDEAGAGVQGLSAPPAPSAEPAAPVDEAAAADGAADEAAAAATVPAPVGRWDGVPVAPGADQVEHLLNRLTFGSSPADRAAVAAGGLVAWLERQFDPQSLPDPDGDAVRSGLPLAFADLATVRSSVEQYAWTAAQHTGWATLGLQMFSSRQFHEVLSDLFANLLNVTTPSEPTWCAGPDYQAQVIRRHATGTYRDMLLASGRHPAMLRYLDNASSTGASVNENYGRELLELHTVGLSAGFTEADVRGSAEILTGRGVDENDNFAYRPDRHKVGPITVLGFSDANADAAGGLDAGDRYLSYLAGHPATAASVARKIAVRFVSDLPSPDLVDRLAQVYLASDTAILPVVRAVVNDPEFWAATGQKVRRPLEDLLGTARALGLRSTGVLAKDLEDAYWATVTAGHAPLGWIPPNGYPDVAAAWMSAGGMVSSWNMHRHLSGGYLGGLKPPAPLKQTHAPSGTTTYREWIGGLSADLLGRAPTETTVLAICTRFGASPDQVVETWMDGQASTVAALLFDSPQFQLR